MNRRWRVDNLNPPNPPSSLPCPNCGRLVSKTAERCIHCGLLRPGRFADVPILGDLLRGRLSFVDSLVITCFVLYALALVLDPGSAMNFSRGLFNLLSPSGEALYKLGMGGLFPLLQGRSWTLVTAVYLHGGILHIGFNMLWLRQIGPWVEDLFGPSRFVIIYTVAGIVGVALSAAAGTPFTVGASGAIFGLFGALVYYGRARGGTFGSTVFRQVAFYAVIGFVFGMLMPNVDNWGHLGGFIGGWLAAWLLGFEERQSQRLWHHLGALVTLGLIALSFVLTFITFFIQS